jgi:hypothetical protein
MRTNQVGVCVVGLGLAWMVACGAATSTTQGPTPSSTSDGGGTQNGGGDGGSQSNTDGGETTTSCAEVSSVASETKRPVDIIFVVDNSGSMSEEIQAIQRNINTNFAAIIGASGLDYRVIMLSRHGSYTSYNICIEPPLSGNATCTPPPSQATYGARFFHYSTFINSNDSFDKILSTYKTTDLTGRPTGGWSTWLRAGALKVFVELTDDSPSTTSASFDAKLLALTPAMFGTATKRDYVFHSIAGFKANTPATQAWAPTDPIQTTKCASAYNTGVGYQELSQLTGGLRFPVCETSSYDVVFQAVAAGVVDGAKAQCEYAVPELPIGKELAQIYVEYTPGNGGAVQKFTKVGSAGACSSAAFYLEGGSIKLCPAACSGVQADDKAKVKVVFSCETVIG